jgi:molecular chaperone GrpE
MFRQTFSSTSSRALRSVAPQISAKQPLLRPQFRTTAPAYSLRAAQPSMSRFYSESKDKPAEEAKEESKGEADQVPELKKSLEAKETEAREWKDKCMRTVADFRNLQDRTERDVKSARDFAIQKFAKDLIDSIDNFDRALSTVPAEKLTSGENQDLTNFHEGIKMTEKILMQTLSKHGLERLEPEGAKFNPNEHEATFMAPQADKEDSTVFHVQQKGFKLNGRVLRAAKVGVVKNK